MPGHDEIPGPDLLISRHLHAGSIGVGEPVVEALVDGISDVPPVAEDRDVFALKAGGDVGVGGISCYRDRVTSVQAVVVAIPADRFAQPVPACGP